MLWQETQVLDRTMPISTWGAATFKCMTIKSPPCPIKYLIKKYDVMWRWQAIQVLHRASLLVPGGLHHLSARLSKAKLNLSKKRWNNMFFRRWVRVRWGFSDGWRRGFKLVFLVVTLKNVWFLKWMLEWVAWFSHWCVSALG